MEYLFSVYWREIEIGNCYIRKNKFVFFYNQDGIKNANKYGFDRLIGFPNINQFYINDTLFPIFEGRIMASKRLTFKNDKEKINYLISTEGRLITDNISIRKVENTYGQHRI